MKLTIEKARWIVAHPENYSDLGPMVWWQVHHAQGFVEGYEAANAEKKRAKRGKK